MPRRAAASRGTTCTTPSAARCGAWRRCGSTRSRDRPFFSALRFDAVGVAGRRGGDARPARPPRGGVLSLAARQRLRGRRRRGPARVWVETDIRGGLPSFTVVGLADKAVREARERVRAAIVNSGYEFPAKRITVNLAPAYLRKVGPGFDLPMAMAILAASGQLAPEALQRCAVVGELSLTGEVRATRGTLAVAEAAERHGLRRLLLPRARAREAALVPALEVLGVETLQEAVEVARGEREPAPIPDAGAVVGRPGRRARPERRPRPQRPRPGAGDRRGRRPQPVHARPAGHGQDHDRAAAAVAAAAADAARRRSRSRACTPWPACTAAAGWSRSARSARRTTRSRPRGWSAAAARLRRGRSTLAHHGVLFLDELSEFARPALEALRQPLEDGRVTIVRAQRVIVFPTRCTLVAASNPCPCGREEPRAPARRPTWRATAAG